MKGKLDRSENWNLVEGSKPGTAAVVLPPMWQQELHSLVFLKGCSFLKYPFFRVFWFLTSTPLMRVWSVEYISNKLLTLYVPSVWGKSKFSILVLLTGPAILNKSPRTSPLPDFLTWKTRNLDNLQIPFHKIPFIYDSSWGNITSSF